jgi:hypothetical protein
MSEIHGRPALGKRRTLEKILQNGPVKKGRFSEKTPVRACASHLEPLKIKEFQAFDGEEFLMLHASIEPIPEY